MGVCKECQRDDSPTSASGKVKITALPSLSESALDESFQERKRKHKSAPNLGDSFAASRAVELPADSKFKNAETEQDNGAPRTRPPSYQRPPSYLHPLTWKDHAKPSSGEDEEPAVFETVSVGGNGNASDEEQLTKKDDKPPNPATIEVAGWRRIALVGAALSGLFLGFLDTTIVSVALPTIANDFDDFAHSTWVVTAYLLSYMGEQNCAS